MRRRAAALLVVGLVAGWPTVAATQAQRERFEARLFADVAAPGFPEGIAVAPDRTVYVSTAPNFGGPGGRPPSRVFAYGPDGTLQRAYTVRGQDRDAPGYGVYGIALDGDGILHLADQSPGRVVALDPHTGTQRDYARLPDVPSCTAAPAGQPCSETLLDLAPFPNVPVFGPDGSLYVTDAAQALVWRVPPGGGKPKVWLTDRRLEGPIGPNGLAFAADGRTLLLAQSNFPPVPTAGSLGGRVWAIPLRPDGSAGELRPFWDSLPLEVPDGLAVAVSGNVYVALAGSNAVALLSPSGRLLTRTPPEPPPLIDTDPARFDQPANMAFDGERMLVTNIALFTRRDFRVLDVFAGEPGMPLFTP